MVVFNGLIGVMLLYFVVLFGDVMWLFVVDNFNVVFDVVFVVDVVIFLYCWGVGNIKIVVVV